MLHQLQQKLTTLTTQYQHLKRQSRYSQYITIMKQLANIKKTIYGTNHQQFLNALSEICEHLNLAAMHALEHQHYDQAIGYLKQAQLAARDQPTLKSTTYNNIACYYRLIGKPRTAISYLHQALNLQLKLPSPKNIGDTHLNSCVVLSQLNRHQDALQHSMLSIIFLQDQLLNNLLSKQQPYESNHKTQIKNTDKLSALAIAYHNLAVQLQHLQRFQQSLLFYRKLLTFSNTNLNSNKHLHTNLTKILLKATKQLQSHSQPSSSLTHSPKKYSHGDLYKSLQKYQDCHQLNTILLLPQNKFNIYGKPSKNYLNLSKCFQHKIAKSNSKSDQKYPSNGQLRPKFKNKDHLKIRATKSYFYNNHQFIKDNNEL